MTIIFLVLIFGIGSINLYSTTPIIKEKLAQDNGYFFKLGGVLEEDYRVNFWIRREWINLYGLFQKILGREIIGNVEFAKTVNNNLDIVVGEGGGKNFADDLLKLKVFFDEKRIPLLYIQYPPREAKDSKDPVQLFRLRDYYEDINKYLKNQNIVYLGEDDILNKNFELNDFYFKTDIHPTTKAEIWMANKISEKLLQEFDIDIKNIISENDLCFEKHAHQFLGNFAQNVGEYYIGTDLFEEYIPKEPTYLKVKEIYGMWQREGDFEETVMNNYDQQDGNEIYTYWVTNYLMFGSKGYHIENMKNTEGPSLLIICDSMCYRTVSYLSLGCKNITVLDPRFYQGSEDDVMKKVLLEKKYDAAIVLHGTQFVL